MISIDLIDHDGNINRYGTEPCFVTLRDIWPTQRYLTYYPLQPFKYEDHRERLSGEGELMRRFVAHVAEIPLYRKAIVPVEVSLNYTEAGSLTRGITIDLSQITAPDLVWLTSMLRYVDEFPTSVRAYDLLLRKGVSPLYAVLLCGCVGVLYKGMTKCRIEYYPGGHKTIGMRGLSPEGVRRLADRLVLRTPTEGVPVAKVERGLDRYRGGSALIEGPVPVTIDNLARSFVDSGVEVDRLFDMFITEFEKVGVDIRRGEGYASWCCSI